MSVRETKLVVVTGRKRIGKSNETLRMLFKQYIRGQHARKVLIFDPNNEYGAYELYDRGVKTIVNVGLLGHNDILKFNKQKVVEIRRIVPINQYGYPLSPDEQDDLIVKMMTEFRGGCLWIEDLNTVFGDNLPKKVSGFFSNNAHRDCDIIMQMQSIGRILPKMWQNTQIVRFHAQLDSVDQSRNKLKEDYEIFKIAQLMVNFQYDHGNVRFFVYVDKEDKKIRGGYSRAMFEKAAMDYIGENEGLVKKELNRVDFATGKRKHSPESALKAVMSRLIKEYCTV